MRRPPHGATTRPGPDRPASGYGRLPGRPGPATGGTFGVLVVLDDAPVDLVALERDQQLEPVELIDLDQAVISANALASPGEPGPVPAI
jgi:hypothetical protein